MKRYVFVLLALIVTAPAFAVSRDLVKMTPRDSFFVIASDVSDLRDNDVFLNMQKNGEIWAFDENSNMNQTFEALKIDPKKDLSAFLFSRYINPYGNKGKVYLLEVTREPDLSAMESTTYLDVNIRRLDAQKDLFAASLAPRTLAVGGLTGVKTAVDVSRGKQQGLIKNTGLNTLFGKVPKQAAFWGMAMPLSRTDAAARGAEQSTNAMLQAFENYYFYGIPTKQNVNSHFVGRAKSESEASFVRTFMIGTLTFAKFKADESVADMLDTVDIQREGLDIHVSGTVTKDVTDSYFNGDLGVK